jgi:general secretion pathway protein H
MPTSDRGGFETTICAHLAVTQLIRVRRVLPRGYTLVELLVVAAIIGIAVSAATLAWRSDPAMLLESEARRLAGQLELAQARARISGARVAFTAQPQSYGFWQRDASGLWREIGNDDALKPKTLDERLSVVALLVAGMPVEFGRRIALPGHDPAPLAITLQGPGSRAFVRSGEFAGRVDVVIQRDGAQ